MANIINKWDEAPHRPTSGAPIDPLRMAQLARQQMGDGLMLMTSIVSCARHGAETVREEMDPLTGRIKKSNRLMSQPCFACIHVQKAAMVHHSGLKEIRALYLMPGVVYVCEMCKRKIEERLFKMDETIVSCCWSCVQDMATWIKREDPSKFTDFSMAANIKFDPMNSKKIG